MTRQRVFLTHTPAALANYYGPRAVAALREMADVVINPTAEVLDAEGLIAHAGGCAVVVSDRATPGFSSFFGRSPDLIAFLRCAVDIRNVDVEAASRHGILVTHATPGFVASVAELGMGMMIDLARDLSASVCIYRSGEIPVPRMGRQLQGSTVGLIGYGVIAQHVAKLATHDHSCVRSLQGNRRSRREAGVLGSVARAVGFRGLSCGGDGRHGKPHERGRLRAHEARGVLHQPVARQSRRRGGAAGGA
jgi:D-3-phosphoglycerate dehydrogenase